MSSRDQTNIIGDVDSTRTVSEESSAQGVISLITTETHGKLSEKAHAPGSPACKHDELVATLSKFAENPSNDLSCSETIIGLTVALEHLLAQNPDQCAHPDPLRHLASKTCIAGAEKFVGDVENELAAPRTSLREAAQPKEDSDLATFIWNPHVCLREARELLARAESFLQKIRGLDASSLQTRLRECRGRIESLERDAPDSLAALGGTKRALLHTREGMSSYSKRTGSVDPEIRRHRTEDALRQLKQLEEDSSKANFCEACRAELRQAWVAQIHRRIDSGLFCIDDLGDYFDKIVLTITHSLLDEISFIERSFPGDPRLSDERVKMVDQLDQLEREGQEEDDGDLDLEQLSEARRLVQNS